MHKLRVHFDDADVLAAISSAPPEIMRDLGRGVSRGAQELARELKRNAPKAHSTLTNSIIVANIGSLERIVGPTVGYAEDVVADNPAQPMPPVQSIFDWIRVKGIEPQSPGMDQEDLAFVIARAIAEKGTHPNMFIDDTREAMQDRVQELVLGSAMNGLRRVGLM